MLSNFKFFIFLFFINILPPSSVFSMTAKERWQKAMSILKRRVPVYGLGNRWQEHDFKVSRESMAVKRNGKIVTYCIDRYYPILFAIQKLVEEYWPDLGPVNVRSLNGGNSTGAMFVVSRQSNQNKNIFFIKVSSFYKREAPENLRRLQESSVGKLLSIHQNNPAKYFELPILASLECLFSYCDLNGDLYYVEVTHAAHGCEVYELLKNGSMSVEDCGNMGLAAGRATGSFHCTCACSGDVNDPELLGTFVHDDLHEKNMFVHYSQPSELPISFQRKSVFAMHTKFTDQVDAMMKNIAECQDRSVQPFYRVSFIDNELMARSLTAPKSILVDVMYPIFVPTIHWRSIISDETWERCKYFFKGFLRGYVMSYPKQTQERLAMYLRAEFLLRITFLRKVHEFDQETASDLFFCSTDKIMVCNIPAVRLNNLEEIIEEVFP